MLPLPGVQPPLGVLSLANRLVWVTPVSLRSVCGYTPREVERVRRIVLANRHLLLGRWHEFFDEGT
jgi:hypothetical protein